MEVVAGAAASLTFGDGDVGAEDEGVEVEEELREWARWVADETEEVSDEGE